MNIKKIMNDYPKGTKVMCLFSKDQNPVPKGTIGTVESVSEDAAIHVVWENGQEVALVPGRDEWEVLIGENKC